MRNSVRHVLYVPSVLISFKVRELTVCPREQYEALQSARQCQKTSELKTEYVIRVGVERTLA